MGWRRLVREGRQQDEHGLPATATTTATILAHAMVREGIKAGGGRDEPDGSQGAASTWLSTRWSKDIEKRSKKVSTNDEIAQVGTISANGDPENRPHGSQRR